MPSALSLAGPRPKLDAEIEKFHAEVRALHAPPELVSQAAE